MNDADSDRACGCKVGRIADEHLTEGVNETLRARWVGDGTEEQSVRDLERYFNKRILEQRLLDADMELLDGEVDNIYRLLSGDTSRGMETQVDRKLERNGVDVDTLRDDFVSHQTIYRHLTSCLDIERDDSMTPEERIERERDRIGRLRNKSEAVSEEALERLRQNDILTLGRFDVIVSFRVACEDCGAHRDLSDVIRNGGCDCGE
jgi:hypothetical protein